MAVLESGYHWLDFADHQYLAPPERPKPAEVAPVLGATIAELDPTAVFFPMGLGNPDHVMVHEACLLVRDGAARPRVVLLRGPRLQAPPGPAGLAGGEAAALATLADPGHRPPRARRGAQAAGHLVLHVADPTARAGPHAHGPHGGPRPRAVLAAGAAPARDGKAWPTSSEAGRETTRPGESGGPSTGPGPAEALSGCQVAGAGGTDRPDRADTWSRTGTRAGAGQSSARTKCSAGERTTRLTVLPDPDVVHDGHPRGPGESDQDFDSLLR